MMQEELVISVEPLYCTLRVTECCHAIFFLELDQYPLQSSVGSTAVHWTLILAGTTLLSELGQREMLPSALHLLTQKQEDHVRLFLSVS